MKNLYFKNIRRDKLANIIYSNICFYILIKENIVKIDYVNSADTW
jgi:hypothetical protein